MQLLHVTTFWFRLASNILLDLFLYVHIKYKITGCLLCLFKSRPLQFYCISWFDLAFRVDDLIILFDLRHAGSDIAVAFVSCDDDPFWCYLAARHLEGC